MERKTVWRLMLTGCAITWMILYLGLNKILSYLCFFILLFDFANTGPAFAGFFLFVTRLFNNIWKTCRNIDFQIFKERLNWLHLGFIE